MINLDIITVKEENVANPKLLVEWDVKKAGGEMYSSSLVLSRCWRKKKKKVN